MTNIAGLFETSDPARDLVDPDLIFEAPVASCSECSLRDAVLPQALFIRTVGVERKRAERAGRRLVLMLIKSTAFLPTAQAPATDMILLALARSTRATDITGWYQEGSILGVLFTEIGPTETPIVEILSRKVRVALRDVAGIQQPRETQLSFHVFPDDCQTQGPARRAFPVFYPDLVRELDSKRIPLAVKRCIDTVGSLLLILLLSPLLLLIASSVKLTSRGPAIFRQKRLGQFGVGFTFLKFRSMHTDTDPSIHEEYVKHFIAAQSDSGEDGNSSKVFKLKNDPRVTKIGSFLRRTSLDELPQLFNVLTGKMSLVGPRPPLPYEVESYETWHRCRLVAVKPGITGFWQVHGRSRVKFDDMVRMDLHYATGWSLWLDIKILLRTPLAVLTGNGAY